MTETEREFWRCLGHAEQKYEDIEHVHALAVELANLTGRSVHLGVECWFNPPIRLATEMMWYPRETRTP